MYTLEKERRRKRSVAEEDRTEGFSFWFSWVMLSDVFFRDGRGTRDGKTETSEEVFYFVFVCCNVHLIIEIQSQQSFQI